MSSDNIAVTVQDLSKCFQIYNRPEDRLKQSIIPRIKRFLELPTEKYFHEFWALRNISLQIRKGETVGIVGRNGSGKSTLLQIICGTLTPTGGSVQTKGRIAALLELGSGFNPEFTGKENIYLYGALLGLSRKEIDSKYEDILSFADIGEFIDQPIKTYSSGMSVRLAFAVAINVDPDILVVDEALAVGDELFQRKCFSKIESIKQKGATILFVSHSGGMVIELCDRAILIDAGEKLTEGEPKNIIGAYQKLLYAPIEKQLHLREVIKSGNYLLADAADNLSVEFRKSELDETVKESYDSGFIPTSTIEYSSQGAVIKDAHIELLSGERVNNLVSGKKYNYVYFVEFTKSIDNVRFGMLIKTTSGFELGGGISSSNSLQGVRHVDAKTRYKVKFTFECSLNPGVYYLNAGVLGFTGETETYLHRVIDIAMFRVLAIENSLSTMTVNFSPVAQIELER
jgi:lipopolysaccharide transport system ATP-binding protein